MHVQYHTPLLATQPQQPHHDPQLPQSFSPIPPHLMTQSKNEIITNYSNHNPPLHVTQQQPPILPPKQQQQLQQQTPPPLMHHQSVPVLHSLPPQTHLVQSSSTLSLGLEYSAEELKEIEQRMAANRRAVEEQKLRKNIQQDFKQQKQEDKMHSKNDVANNFNNVTVRKLSNATQTELIEQKKAAGGAATRPNNNNNINNNNSNNIEAEEADQEEEFEKKYRAEIEAKVRKEMESIEAQIRMEMQMRLQSHQLLNSSVIEQQISQQQWISMVKYI